jgi:dihydrofolate synthase/folylpolyglutamate synthase
MTDLAPTPWDRLFARRRFGIKPGLDVVRAMLAELGDPHRTFPVLHVAGTNGKGSVCVLAASILQALGLRTGLTTSPHLVRFNERFRVDGRDIEDAALLDLAARVEDVAARVQDRLGQEPTFFECSMAMAFEYFRQEGVDASVVEVGLGGRLDATNVVTPVATAITRISREHEQILGAGIPTIAGEKAGIIKPGVPVICGANAGEALAVIARVARERGAPLVLASEAASVAAVAADLDGQKVRLQTQDNDYGTLTLPLAGPHQLENLATAILLVERAAEALGIELTRKAAKAGIEATRWPGRLTVVERDPPVIVDGAHNPGAGEALAAACRKLLGRAPVGLVMGMCADKDEHEFMRPFTGVAARMWTVPIRSERNMPAERIRAAAAACGIAAEARPTVAEALREAREWARAAGGAVVVAGSLYLAGEVLAAARGETMGETV